MWLPTFFVDRLIEFRPIKTIHPLDSLRVVEEEGEEFAFAHQVSGLEGETTVSAIITFKIPIGIRHKCTKSNHF